MIRKNRKCSPRFMVERPWSIIICVLIGIVVGCKPRQGESALAPAPDVTSFVSDVAFLRQFTEVIVLEAPSERGRIAVAPALQGRVMTSTTNAEHGRSLGWINKELFESGDTLEHINAFGGEERFWLGPEGGQFSIFFKKDAPFTFDNWYTPSVIDVEPFELVSATKEKAVFKKSSSITNYSGTVFNISINRSLEVLDENRIKADLLLRKMPQVDFVAYRSVNTLMNSGPAAWKKETGLLSIWLLGMFHPSPQTTIILPYQTAVSSGPVVNDDYFGKVPPDRLKVKNGVVYFKADGKFRSKIGLSPGRADDIMGSYDAGSNTLTIIKFDKPYGARDYVNSKWEIQARPFEGDVTNAYNDGPVSPGAKPLGPFYELESSSPAIALGAGEQLVHTQTTFHFVGDRDQLNILSELLLRASLDQIEEAF